MVHTYYEIQPACSAARLSIFAHRRVTFLAHCVKLERFLLVASSRNEKGEKAMNIKSCFRRFTSKLLEQTRALDFMNRVVERMFGSLRISPVSKMVT